MLAGCSCFEGDVLLEHYFCAPHFKGVLLEELGVGTAPVPSWHCCSHPSGLAAVGDEQAFSSPFLQKEILLLIPALTRCFCLNFLLSLEWVESKSHIQISKVLFFSFYL